jgi:putative tryptophan/tyrosine transport system substrate-binding protein
MPDLRRRQFITLLGGAAAAWPFATHAQQPERMRRIGIILPAAADDAEFQTWVEAFLQALAQLGWVIGRNVRIDTRWATTNSANIRRHAAELAALGPDVILASGTLTVGPMLQATRTVPIVFPIVVDPVGSGFVDSLARPSKRRPPVPSDHFARLPDAGCRDAASDEATRVWGWPFRS